MPIIQNSKKESERGRYTDTQIDPFFFFKDPEKIQAKTRRIKTRLRSRKLTIGKDCVTQELKRKSTHSAES